MVIIVVRHAIFGRIVSDIVAPGFASMDIERDIVGSQCRCDVTGSADCVTTVTVDSLVTAVPRTAGPVSWATSVRYLPHVRASFGVPC